MSIFDKVRAYKPMTPERRKTLRSELIAIACALAAIPLFYYCSPLLALVGEGLCWLLAPIFWLLGVILTPVGLVIQWLVNAMVANIHPSQESSVILIILANTALFGIFAFIMLYTAIIAANGIHRTVGHSVLWEEIWRMVTKHLPPSLKLQMVAPTVSQEFNSTVLSLGFWFLFFWFTLSGGFSQVFAFVPHITEFENAAQQGFVYMVNEKCPQLQFTMNMEQWAHLRMFLSAFASMIAAVPFSLMCGASSVLPSPTVILTPRHIRFPMASALGLKLRTKRLWTDVARVRFLHDNKVEFQFRTGGSAVVDTSSMIETDAETLLQGIEELCTDCEVDPAIAECAANNARNEKSFGSSFTHVWDEGVGSQYKSTVFVPTAAGATLHNGGLRVIRQMASTPWSATFLARTEDHKLVVLKELVLPDNGNGNAKAKELFERECQMLLSLRHPGVSRVLDHFVEKDRDYLVLAFTPGRDLQEIVRLKGPMKEMQARDIAIQLCEILQYLHNLETPIVHRDVSPDNIVLDDDNRAHLIDFGAAKHLVQNATGTLIGKQSYIAPEQLRGKPSAQSDLYALGATLYHLLTGKQPMALQQCSPRKANRRVSEEMDALVRSLTAFDETDRPESAAAVIEKLRGMKGVSQLTVIGHKIKLKVPQNA